MHNASDGNSPQDAVNLTQGSRPSLSIRTHSRTGMDAFVSDCQWGGF